MGRLEMKCPHCKQLLEEEKINRLNVLEKRRKAIAEIENARIAKQNPFLRKASNYARNIFIGFMLIIMAIIILHTG